MLYDDLFWSLEDEARYAAAAEDDPQTGSPSTPALERDLAEVRPAGSGCLAVVALLGALWTVIALLVASRLNG